VTRLFLIPGLALLLASCTVPEAPPSDLEETMEADDLGRVSLSVTCDPHIARYPIAGPHNCGYDGAWSDFRCDSSLANSDYGGDHHGIDIFAARGTPVVAPVDGLVARASWPTSTSGDRVTVVDGCGWGYYHGHLDTIAVAEGTWVRAGDLIGTVGNTGTPTSPHVHFNVHRDGAYSDDIDPIHMLIGAEGTSCGPDPECAFRLDGSVCEDATHISTCSGGDYSAGDCAAFGAVCVADDRLRGVRRLLLGHRRRGSTLHLGVLHRHPERAVRAARRVSAGRPARALQRGRFPGRRGAVPSGNDLHRGTLRRASRRRAASR
jgi:hypothetical protein